MRRALDIEKGPEATLSTELWQREIRERLAAMGGDRAHLVFLDAVEPGGFDEETFLAVKKAPSVYGAFGMDRTLIDDANKTWRALKSPAATREVEQLADVIQRRETTVRTVRAVPPALRFAGQFSARGEPSPNPSRESRASARICENADSRSRKG